MNLKEIVELRDRLRGELETVEKFLEIARRMEPGAPSDKPIAPPIERLDSAQAKLPLVAENEYGKISRVIEQALSLCPEEFNLRDVENCAGKLGHRLSRTQIATTLNRYKDTGKLIVVKERIGNIPATYRRNKIAIAA